MPCLKLHLCWLVSFWCWAGSCIDLPHTSGPDPPKRTTPVGNAQDAPEHFQTWRQDSEPHCGKFSHALSLECIWEHCNWWSHHFPWTTTQHENPMMQNFRGWSCYQTSISVTSHYKDCLEPLSPKGKQSVGQTFNISGLGMSGVRD